MATLTKQTSAAIQAFTNIQTSGIATNMTEDVAVNPATNSTCVQIGNRIQMNFNSGSNVLPGGYMVCQETVLNTSGTGTHDKMVANMSQLNLAGGNVSAAVAYEAVISTVGAGTVVAGFAGFLFANVRGVPNITNVGMLYAFCNQDTVAVIQSDGPFLNATLNEIGPSRSAGLVTGRYYSAPMLSMTQNIVANNVLYVTYVYVPQRCTPTKLGCYVATAATGNVIIGMYMVQNSVPTTLVAQTVSMSTGSTGAVEGAVSTQIDSGVYAIVAVFSATPTMAWHQINNNDMIGNSAPTNYSEYTFFPSFTFGTLPGTINVLPTYASNTIEPHLWFRL